ncbi:hypothetical protein ACI2L1_44535 [Streptomyces sp. NPDC019531]|uniref:hypothetical protein n=1 Tax=Streptomyces sp. NPDC019531 TaxID=3365062 RepID=UPI00384DAB30
MRWRGGPLRYERKAAVFIPLATSAGNEQAHNARHLQETGAAVALEGEVSAQRMRDALGPLLADAHLRQAMAELARAHGRPDAAHPQVPGSAALDDLHTRLNAMQASSHGAWTSSPSRYRRSFTGPCSSAVARRSSSTV